MARVGWILALLACVFVGAGCQTFRPQPIDDLPFKERIETQERDGLRVSVTVLSRDEARKVFGLDLYAEQIQPVWLRLENRTDDPYWFMLHGLDPNYFSTREAAYKSHYLVTSRNQPQDRRSLRASRHHPGRPAKGGDLGLRVRQREARHQGSARSPA